MHISVNTDEPLSDLDKQILAVLAGTTSTVPIADKASEAAARVAAAAAKTAAAAPAKKTAAAPAPEPDPEPEPEEEDLVGGTTRTKDEAIAYATNLVANGGASKVRAALKEIGAAKVTEMDESDVEKFFALVDAD